MRKNSKTSKRQTSASSAAQSTLFQRDFPVSRGQQPEKEKAKQMIDTSGHTCLLHLDKFSHVGSWAKMFLACLIGQGEWYSTRSKLTWKLRGLKSSHHLYCQLAVSTLRTGETEYSLLPTPVVMDSNQGNLQKIDKRRKKAKDKGYNGNGFGVTLGELANRGLLPTPMNNDWKGGRDQQSERVTFQLNDLASIGLLPTPRQSEWKGTGPIGSKSHKHMLKKDYLCAVAQEITGQSGQLNPRFVSELMGYPPDWLELPFLTKEAELESLTKNKHTEGTETNH